MSIFTPLRKRCRNLELAFGKSSFLTISEAANAMEIAGEKVTQTLRKIEEKGFFNGYHPYVDESVGLVIRDRAFSANARVHGHARLILKEIQEARSMLPEYMRKFSPERKKPNQLGKAMLNFAQGFAKGKKTSDNLLDSAMVFFGYDKVEETVDARAVSFVNTLSQLQACTEGLSRISDEEKLYLTETQHQWLLSLRRSIRNWNISGRNALKTGAQDGVTRRTEEELKERFLPVYPDLLKQLTQAPAQVSELDGLMKVLDESIEYLDKAEDQIRTIEVRASVMLIHALTREIRDLYRSAEDNYSCSDARSLRNTYLPMLRALLEKYIQFSENFHTGEAEDPALEETIQLLKQDIPSALIRIRNELKNSRAVDLESEAAALRKKLQMDGLL